MSRRPARNEWQKLGVPHADPAEVVELLATAIGDPPSIVSGFTNSGRPFVHQAEGAPTPDWAALSAKLRAGLSGHTSWITFAMSGRFRKCGSMATPRLQIRPVDGLRPGDQGFPFNRDVGATAGLPLNAILVDAAYEGAADPFIDNLRRHRAVGEAANFMSLVAWPKVWRPDSQSLDWTPVRSVGSDEVVNLKTVHGFHHPALGDQSVRPLVDETRPIATLEHATLAAGPVDRLDGDLYVPDTLGALHLALETLPPPERKRADRALAFYADGIGTANPSTAIASWVASVEALLPESAVKTCTECGQPRFAFSRKVKELLDEHAGKAMSKEYRDTVYNLRSRLVHGRWHYAVDSPPFSLRDESYPDALKVFGSARATLLNWLLARSEGDATSGRP